MPISASTTIDVTTTSAMATALRKIVSSVRARGFGAAPASGLRRNSIQLAITSHTSKASTTISATENRRPISPAPASEATQAPRSKGVHASTMKASTTARMRKRAILSAVGTYALSRASSSGNLARSSSPMRMRRRITCVSSAASAMPTTTATIVCPLAASMKGSASSGYRIEVTRMAAR